MSCQKEISARHYRNRKDNGLCPRCGKELDREGHYCKNCKDKHNEYQMQVKEFCKSIGICPYCRKNKIYEKEKMCDICADKFRGYRKNWKPTDEYKAKCNEKRRILYADRLSKGICVKCGKLKAIDGKTKCYACLEKDATYHRLRR